jgi:hypothetical protein
LQKTRADLTSRVHKPNSCKRSSGNSGQIHSKSTERTQSIRHDSFAAGFIDGRTGGVRHGNAKPAFRRRNARRKSGRTSANDEDICVLG